jgi:hypothetical protein
VAVGVVKVGQPLWTAYGLSVHSDDGSGVDGSYPWLQHLECRERTMARASNNNQKPTGRPSVEKLLETVLEDVLKAASMPYEQWQALSPMPLNPLAIPVESGHYYQATQVGVDAAHELAQKTWEERKDFRQTVARKVFTQLSFKATGEAIAATKRNLPPGEQDHCQPVPDSVYAALAAEYERTLDKLVGGAKLEVDRHIPCHLFHANQAVAAFCVGPVCFLPRSEWFRKYVKDAAQLALIEQVEGGQLQWKELERRASNEGSGTDVQGARRHLQSMGGHPWVATIRLSGNDLQRSHEKAVTLVGLAIDALGLRFQVQDARRFTRAGRQHLYSENRIATTPEGRFLAGWSTEMPGLGSSPGALAAKVAAERPFLDAVGKVLAAYVQGLQSDKPSALVEHWANALYWVGEARRESTDFMAVVKYGCAADVLCGAGGYINRMTDFAEAALNPRNDPPAPKAVTIKEAVRKVYAEGRNKLAHGEMPGLLEDVSETRNLGDLLLCELFDVVTVELAALIEANSPALTVGEEHAYRALKTKLQNRQPANATAPPTD